jgi:hypothetical protein
MIARQALLIRYYERLIRMATVRRDRRLAPRVVPAGVVQETLQEAFEEIGQGRMRDQRQAGD